MLVGQNVVENRLQIAVDLQDLLVICQSFAFAGLQVQLALVIELVQRELEIELLRRTGQRPRLVHIQLHRERTGSNGTLEIVVQVVLVLLQWATEKMVNLLHV